MAADFSIITKHPNCEEIISKLVTGTDPKDINQWLKLLYKKPDQKHLVISVKLLTDFSKSQYTQFYNQYTQEITKSIQTGTKLDKKISDSLLNNKTVKERLADHTLKEINLRDRFLSLDLLMRDRMEQVFDSIQEDPTKFKGDYVLLKYFEQYLSLIEKYDKSQNNRPDQLIQHNYTIQYVDRQTAAIQEAIKRVLSKVDPDLALMLIEEISREVNNIEPPPQMQEAAIISSSPTIEERLNEVKKLEENLREM